MKIAILDCGTLGSDIDLSPLRSLGETAEYSATSPEQVTERLLDAEIAVVNKIKLNHDNLTLCKKLKLICVAATGFDNIDTAYCKAKQDHFSIFIIFIKPVSFSNVYIFHLKPIDCF